MQIPKIDLLELVPGEEPVPVEVQLAEGGLNLDKEVCSA